MQGWITARVMRQETSQSGIHSVVPAGPVSSRVDKLTNRSHWAPKSAGAGLSEKDCGALVDDHAHVPIRANNVCSLGASLSPSISNRFHCQARAPRMHAGGEQTPQPIRPPTSSILRAECGVDNAGR